MFEILQYQQGLGDSVYTCSTLQNVCKDNISSHLTLLHILLMEDVCVAIAYIDIRKQFERFSTHEMK